MLIQITIDTDRQRISVVTDGEVSISKRRSPTKDQVRIAERQKVAHDWVAARPGCSSTEIAKLMGYMGSGQAILPYLNGLIERGLVRREGSRSTSRYFPTAETPR